MGQDVQPGAVRERSRVQNRIARCNGFDTGLTRADGSLRPAYTTLRKYLKTFTR